MPTLVGGVTGYQQDYYPTSSSGGGAPYDGGFSNVFYNPVQPKPSPVTQYSSRYDPFSPNFLGGNQPRWENDPGIFDSGGLLDFFNSYNNSQPYDPQLDNDLARTDPYSVPGSGTDAEKAKEAAKQAAKNGGAANGSQGSGGGGGGGSPEPQYFDGGVAEGRPWWHWALLAGGGGLAVWYLMKKKKKGKK